MLIQLMLILMKIMKSQTTMLPLLLLPKVGQDKFLVNFYDAVYYIE